MGRKGKHEKMISLEKLYAIIQDELNSNNTIPRSEANKKMLSYSDNQLLRILKKANEQTKEE